MPTRTADAEWKGNLQQGTGKMKTASGALSASYDWRSRSADGAGTNPEELIAAAHAGCFSMALSHTLEQAGAKPEQINTKAAVHLEKQGDGFVIPKIELTTEVRASGLDDAKFQELATSAKINCPVSKVLKAAEITLVAKLVAPAATQARSAG